MNLNNKLWNLAKKVIPSGNNFLSKNPIRFNVKGWPIYFQKSKGCYVWDLNKRKYIDFTYMGVGTNILGYSNKKINSSVINSIKKGNMTTLNCPEEPMFAKSLLEPHKWAKMVKFSRTGAEANAIAIRIARAYNKKNKVIICGYHGWQDWYLSAKLLKKNHMDTHLFPNLNTSGVPKFLKGYTYSVKYNDIKTLRHILEKDKDISALIMEVERDVRPNINYLKQIRRLCDKFNTCLIFDECTTGFRENFGGLHLKYKINPDMAMFGKAIGNGFSITAVIGKKKIMNSSLKSFISSTFWSERVGFVAGLATLKEMKRISSWKIIKKNGKYIKEKLKKISIKNNLKIEFSSLDTLIRFKLTNTKIKNYNKFIMFEMLKRGYLANDVIYVSVAHTKKEIIKYLKNLEEVFSLLKKN